MADEAMIDGRSSGICRSSIVHRPLVHAFLNWASLLMASALLSAGCGPTEVDTTYGRSRGKSINGTNAFAEILRQGGHEVRVAVRMTDTLADWATVLVRYSLHPGPPDRDEGRWLYEWLQTRPGRKLVYVIQDYDAESEFWDAMLAAEPKDARAEELDRIKRKRDLAKAWVSDLPPKSKEPANETEWFAIEPKPASPSACKTLGGPWAEGVDVEAASVSKHETFKVTEDEPVLLTGDGSPLAISWSFDNGSQVLAVANASFLLNASLLNRSRRPLTMRVVDWIGTSPRHVAFVEGARPLGGDDESASAGPFHLLQVWPFNWISIHLMAFLLLLALSYAVRLGRPLPEPPSGVERPSAHPEALGALLAKTGRADAARFLLEAYRRWRHPSQVAGRTAPASPPSR
jgi:hypothetical protein